MSVCVWKQRCVCVSRRLSEWERENRAYFMYIPYQPFFFLLFSSGSNSGEDSPGWVECVRIGWWWWLIFWACGLYVRVWYGTLVLGLKCIRYALHARSGRDISRSFFPPSFVRVLGYFPSENREWGMGNRYHHRTAIWFFFPFIRVKETKDILFSPLSSTLTFRSFFIDGEGNWGRKLKV